MAWHSHASAGEQSLLLMDVLRSHVLSADLSSVVQMARKPQDVLVLHHYHLRLVLNWVILLDRLCYLLPLLVLLLMLYLDLYFHLCAAIVRMGNFPHALRLHTRGGSEWLCDPCA